MTNIYHVNYYNISTGMWESVSFTSQKRAGDFARQLTGRTDITVHSVSIWKLLREVGKGKSQPQLDFQFKKSSK